MVSAQVKAPIWIRVRRVALRIIIFLCLAAAVGMALNSVSAALERNSRTAGFARGALQGALMPMSLPNLLIGRDVTIYSLNNTGISYKLGYTAGVNVCGAVFFRFFLLAGPPLKPRQGVIGRFRKSL